MENNIREFRKQLNIPSRILGDYLGLSSEAVLHYENGRRKPDLDMCREIVKFFREHGLKNVTIDSLFPPQKQSA